MGKKHPFDDLIAAAANAMPKADRTVTVNQRWEHKVIQTILSHYGLQSEAAAMARQVKEATGQSRLTFEVFKQTHPSFPTWLVCRKIPWTGDYKAEYMGEKFKESNVYREFMKAESEAPSQYWEGRLGLVFEWLHNGNMCIISNNYRQMNSEGWAFFYSFPKLDQLFAVQPFSAFLDSTAWSPE